MVNLCLVPDCNRKRWARGFCGKHYQAFLQGKDLGVKAIRARRKKGSGTIDPLGYKAIGRVREHQLVVEKALGRKLKRPEQVHHWNEDRKDNRPENLVVCPNNFYHALLHHRQKALAACGNADWRHCKYCKQYSPLKELRSPNGRNSFYHKRCDNKATAKRRNNDRYRERRRNKYHEGCRP